MDKKRLLELAGVQLNEMDHATLRNMKPEQSLAFKLEKIFWDYRNALMSNMSRDEAEATIRKISEASLKQVRSRDTTGKS
jgi:hypothetical protein